MNSFKRIFAAGLCLVGSSLFAASQNIITNADFSDGMSGWRLGGFVGGKPDTDRNWRNDATVIADTDGINALQVSCKDPDGMVVDLTTETGIALDPAWVTAGKLKLSFKAKLAGFAKGGEPWGRAHVWVTFYNDEEKQVGEYISSLSTEIPSWKYIATPVVIPPDATNVKVQIGFISATGVLEVRDLSLVPMPAAK